MELAVTCTRVVDPNRRKMLNKLVSVALIFAVIHQSYGYSTGAPVEVCTSMVPDHGVPPQTSASPVTVVTSATSVSPGGQIQVRVEGIAAAFIFRGYFIQARDLSGQTILGDFLAGTGVTLRTCGTANSAATHSNSAERTYQLLTWRAPSNFSGNVRFQ